MNYDYRVELSTLVGKPIQSFYINGKQDQSSVRGADDVILVTTDNEAFEFSHMQDCCESVSLQSIKGDFRDLIGKPILFVDHKESTDWPPDRADEPSDSFTITTFRIIANGVYITMGWLGTSNGYYSERVYFGRTHRPIKLET